uniref:BZIP domain-containing protein n=1 Tax=Caenorhabditis tropicalis TaxID=1561998 RepID=A0A1I7UK10_9PELO
MLDAYFIDSTTPSTSSSWNNQQPVQMSSIQQSVSTYNQQMPKMNDVDMQGVDGMSVKLGSSPDKGEKDRVKKARQAEAARMRYHRLSNEEKRELNLKRTLAQKRKRQREKEMEELESILRETNDIQEDPDITEQLREKRMRAKWAEAARTRYARMTPEERRAHNTRRRMRQMQNAMSAIKNEEFQACGMATGDPQKDDEAVRQHIKNQNAKKAEAARQRYHRMNDDEKRVYNQRRTEAFRRRRMEEEMLLAMPIGRINGEALDRAQQIVVRNAKRAEAARLRYQRMTPDQRKIAKQEIKEDESWTSPSDTHDHDLGDSYNQKRYTPKRRRNELDDMMAAGQMAVGSSGTITMGTGTPSKKDDMDALSTLERDVVKRTQHAQQILLRQRANQTSTPRSVTPPPQELQSYIISNNQQQQHQQLVGNNGHQVLHQGHMQQQQIQVSHQQSSQPLSQNIYTSGMLIQNQGQQQNQQSQQQNQQILNPYRS